MRDWKKIKKIHLDYYNRDCPCMYWNGNIYIGNRGSTHATMVQEIVYGMSFNNYESEYLDSWNCKETSIMFRRDKIKDIDDTEYLFGSVLEGQIYWDFYDKEVPRELVTELLKNRKYEHYGVNNDREAFMLKVYSNTKGRRG